MQIAITTKEKNLDLEYNDLMQKAQEVYDKL